MGCCSPGSAGTAGNFTRKKQPFAIILIGVCPYLKLNSKYISFFQLFTDQVANEISNVLAYGEETKRAEALAEHDRAKTTFFSNISHEFRTPLTLMLGSIEEMLKDPGKKSKRSSLEMTHRNGLRLLRLVNTLLDFSRIESGRMRAIYQPLDLASYTTDIASSFRSAMESAHLRFDVHCSRLEDAVYVDKEMWEKVVLNLLSNAYKFTLQGEVSVYLYQKEGRMILQVADSGTGIPKSELVHMFDRFHRVKSSAGRSFEGSGIGLALVKELVQLHGGTIDVESTFGTGTTFTVGIPVGKAHLPAEQISELAEEVFTSVSNAYTEEAEVMADYERPESETPTVVNAARRSILVVDDNIDLRIYLQSLLETEYNVDTAANGKEALRKIEHFMPDLLLSDIMMPEMDGVELLKVLKEKTVTARIPVILLTARAGEESRLDGYELGAEDYLVKPFTAKELLARVKAQLSLASARRHVQQQLSGLFLQAPIALSILRGPHYVVEVANEKMLELWGKTAEQLLNKPVFEAMPDAREQGFEQLLNHVYATGERFIADELPLSLIRKGKGETIFVKFVYEALREEDGTITGIMVVADEITEQVSARRKVEESEKRLHNLVEQALNPILILKGEELVLEVANEATLEVWGVEKEALGKRFLEILPEMKDQVFLPLLKDVLHNGVIHRRYQEPAYFVQPNGEKKIIYFNFSYQPYRETDGSISGVIVVATDVTQQVTAAMALRKNQEQLQDILRQAPVAMAIYRGPRYVIEVANEKMLEFWDRPAAEVLNKPLFEVFPEANAPGVQEMLSKVVKENKGYYASEYASRLKRHNTADTVYVNFAMEPIMDMDGKVSSVMVMVNDITKIVKGRKKLEDSEERLQLAIEASEMGTFDYHIASEGFVFSPRLYHIFGFSTPTGANPKDFQRRIHPDDDNARAKAVKEAIRSGRLSVEVRIIWPDTSVHWIQIKGKIIYTSTGRPARISGIVVDITNRKLADQQKFDFMAIVSHELKTPVTSMKGYIQMLEEEFRMKSELIAASHLSKVDRQIDKLSLLTGDLLDLTKIESGKLEFNLEKFDFDELVGEVVKSMQYLSPTHKIVYTGKTRAVVTADRNRIEQVLTNLISNAVKYSPGADRVLVYTYVKNDSALISVEDRGLGIPEEETRKVFERYYRARNTKFKSGGLGLGLYISAEIVKRHGGEIWVESEPGKGSLFYFSLPLNQTT